MKNHKYFGRYFFLIYLIFGIIIIPSSIISSFSSISVEDTIIISSDGAASGFSPLEIRLEPNTEYLIVLDLKNNFKTNLMIDIDHDLSRDITFDPDDILIGPPNGVEGILNQTVWQHLWTTPQQNGRIFYYSGYYHNKPFFRGSFIIGELPPVTAGFNFLPVFVIGVIGIIIVKNLRKKF